MTVEKKEVAQQAKLGAFVLVGLGLFLATVFMIGSENNIFSRKFTISAIFKNVEGLKEGDNVWLSGVKVGTVKNVKIAAQGTVIVDLSLKGKQNEFITKDATVAISSDGLVGNKIVIIRPGASHTPVEDKDTLSTSSPADTQELMNIAKDVGDNTKALTYSLSVIAKRINEGKGIVGELLNDGDLAHEIRQAVVNLQTSGNNTAKATAELHALLYDLRNGQGLMPTLVRDSTYATTFKATLVNLEAVSANAQQVASNLETLTAKINSDDNAIGVLLSDEKLADRIRSTINNAEQATEKLDENMEALQHNFLLRGYFKKQEKRRSKDAAASKGPRARN